MSISKKRIKKIASKKDSAIDYSEIAELDESFWKMAKLIKPEKKHLVPILVSLQICFDASEAFATDYLLAYQKNEFLEFCEGSGLVLTVLVLGVCSIGCAIFRKYRSALIFLVTMVAIFLFRSAIIYLFNDVAVP